MKRKTTFLKSLLVAVGLLAGAANSFADDWDVVWSADFSSAPSGMTYSVSNGSVDISSGVLFYHQGGGSGNRAINTSFTDSKFNVDTNWQMEFDWGASSANTNASNVAFATNNGTAFTITWDKYATAVTIADANSEALTTTLPIDGYNKSTMTNLSHFVITGDTENGIYLTVTNEGTTYIDNVLVSSSYGYPATFNGSLGRAASHMALDNIIFKTPAVAGYVAEPTENLIGVNGTARIFTLSTLTEDASIFWSETAPAEGEDFSSWTAYAGSVETSAATIYAVAIKGSDVSAVATISTGAGSEIELNAPAITVTGLVANGGLFNPIMSASNDQSSVLLAPTASISATFNGETVSLPYTVTTDGTLVVTVSADGYASSSSQYDVKALYKKTWTSTDYSTVTAENVTSVLGEGWTLQEVTGRWASWSSALEPYTYYQNTDGEGVFNVTVEENVRVRSVVLLNLGYGLSRNISGTEAINFLNTKEGTIAEVKYYNGYGAAVSESNTHYTYLLNNGGMPTYGCNNGNVLVQVAYYNPYLTVTPELTKISDDQYAASFSSQYALDFTNTATKAYVARSVSNETVTLDRVSGTVAANTGLLLLLSDGTSSEIIPVVDEGTEYPTNLLVAVSSDTEAPVGSYVFALQNNDAVFTQVAEGKQPTVKAGHAYLQVASEAKALTLSFADGTVTGINSISAEKKTSNDIFNLAGQRVAAPQKGLYIMNGKKVIVK